MLIHLLAIAFSVLASDADVERLRSHMPTRLTTETARLHLGAARAAADRYEADPVDVIDGALLLAIAGHETGFDPTLVATEADGATSCGLGMVSGHRPCTPEQLTLVGGYLASAASLRDAAEWCAWSQHRMDIGCALTVYAGGPDVAIRNGLRNGPVVTEFLRRAAEIRGTR